MDYGRTRTSASAPPVAKTPHGCTSALSTGSFLPASPPCQVIWGVVIFIPWMWRGVAAGLGGMMGSSPSMLLAEDAPGLRLAWLGVVCALLLPCVVGRRTWVSGSVVAGWLALDTHGNTRRRISAVWRRPSRGFPPSRPQRAPKPSSSSAQDRS